MTPQSINDQLELLRLKELFMSDINVRTNIAVACSRGVDENPAYHSLCALTHCPPSVAKLFAEQLLIDVMLTPEEIVAERERLERMKL